MDFIPTTIRGLFDTSIQFGLWNQIVGTCLWHVSMQTAICPDTLPAKKLSS